MLKIFKEHAELNGEEVTLAVWAQSRPAGGVAHDRAQ